MIKIKNIFLSICGVLILQVVSAQTDTINTIKIRKSNCLDFYLHFASINRDTITVSELKKGFAFMPGLDNCKEEQKFEIESYDISLNQEPAIHLNSQFVKANTFRSNNTGTLTISNCVLNIKKTGQQDSKFIIPTQTFYIIKDENNSEITPNSFEETNESTTQLLDSTFLTKSPRTIILLETDTFVVFTTYKLFVDNSKQFINKHNLEWDKDLLKLFTDNNSKIIYADSLPMSNLNKSRLKFRMADLLESGQCLIYNKQKKSLEKIVYTEIYSTSSVKGRRIKTNEKYLILETVERVY